jgi:hypothetical protein
MTIEQNYDSISGGNIDRDITKRDDHEKDCLPP